MFALVIIFSCMNFTFANIEVSKPQLVEAYKRFAIEAKASHTKSAKYKLIKKIDSFWQQDLVFKNKQAQAYANELLAAWEQVNKTKLTKSKLTCQESIYSMRNAFGLTNFSDNQRKTPAYVKQTEEVLTSLCQ